MKGVIGRKVGMTQVFDEAGTRVPVTVVEVAGNVVIKKKTAEGKDGYNAVKIGFTGCTRQEKSGMIRYRGANAPEAGVFLKLGIDPPRRHVREFRITAAELDEIKVGEELAIETLFSAGDRVDVTGTSKGHGFTGVIKRHGYSRPKMTHGTHEFFRHGGAIGASAYPARVFKGKAMAGQHGNKRATVQNLRVVEVIPEDGLVLIKGAIPGHNGAIVSVSQAVKRKRSLA